MTDEKNNTVNLGWILIRCQLDVILTYLTVICGKDAPIKKKSLYQ